VELPRNSLVVAFFHGEDLTIPGGDDRAEPGDDALILGTTDVIDDAELVVTTNKKVLGSVVLAGGGDTGRAVAKALEPLKLRVKIIERDRDDVYAILILIVELDKKREFFNTGNTPGSPKVNQ